MTWVNYDDALRQVQAAGLDVAHIEVDTPRPVRCREVNGDREKRGWYWLHEISLETPKGSGQYGRFIVGSFGIYRGNDHGKQKIRLSARGLALNAETAAAIRARHAESVKRAAAIRAAEQDRAAHEAAHAWGKYLPSNPDGTLPDYLHRKGVQAHGIRYSPSGNGTLAIPMTDATGKVWGLQIIRGKQRGRRLEKQYWPAGMNKTGHYHMLGSPGAVILLAEGYATGATIFEATGLCVVVAFDANNLLSVAQALHKTYRHAHILVCADDDYLTDGNPGVASAQNAAIAVRGSVVKPEFPADRAGKKLTDFNDLATVPNGGLHLVRAQIEAALTKAGVDVRLSKQRVAVGPPDGAGLPPAQGDGGSNNGYDSNRRAEAIMPLNKLIERYVPIDDGTGDHVFDQWTNKIARKTQMLALLPAGVRGDDIKRHPFWIDRGAYFIHQVGFDPSGTDPQVKLNTWRGWQVQPSDKGTCELLLELLYWLCSEEENPDEVYHWLLQWMAYPLQHPGAKMASAVIMHGPQGTGKSTVFQTLGKIYGDYGTILNQRGLEDKFNSDWADSRLYLLAEEVVTRQEMWAIKNELKELVTGEWIRVNPKNLAAYRQRNQMNIVYLSNEGQPLPLENDDRRHLVVYTPPMQPEWVYDKIHKEIANGGLEAFYHHLLFNVDTSDFHPKKRPPMTRSKQALIDLSLPSEAVFIREWQSGQLEFNDADGPLPFCPCTGRQLYAAYKKWAGIAGVTRPRDEVQFIGYVGRLHGWRAGKPCPTFETLNSTARKMRRMVIPSEEAMAQAKLAGAYTLEQKEGQTMATWLTASFYAFKKVAEGEL